MFWEKIFNTNRLLNSAHKSQAIGLIYLRSAKFLFFYPTSWFLFSTVLQYGLLTLLPSKISGYTQKKSPKSNRYRKPPHLKNANANPNQNDTFKKVTRIVISSVLFGIVHAGVAEMINIQERRFSNDIVLDRSWMQITGSFAAGLVYRSVYELSGQNLFAAWGTHALYNYFYDCMSFDFWY